MRNFFVSCYRDLYAVLMFEFLNFTNRLCHSANCTNESPYFILCILDSPSFNTLHTQKSIAIYEERDGSFLPHKIKERRTLEH